MYDENLKSWYIYTLVDLYAYYSIGHLEPLPEQYANAAVNCQAGKDRKELIRVCSDISVGQVVLLLETTLNLVC